MFYVRYPNRVSLIPVGESHSPRFCDPKYCPFVTTSVCHIANTKLRSLLLTVEKKGNGGWLLVAILGKI